MTNPFFSRFFFSTLTASALACASTPTNEAETKPTATPAANTTKSSPEMKATTASAVAQIVENFQRVHFEFDSAQLSTTTREALQANTDLMRKHPEISVEIQGHCDDRGTTEYNLSLGDRRAKAIHDYMAKAGIESGRLTSISFGKERPLDKGGSESAWSKNRRAEFRVLVEGQSAPLASIRGTTEQ